MALFRMKPQYRKRSKTLSYYGTVSGTRRMELAATSVGDYALFGGGNGSNVVDAYNTHLIKTNPSSLASDRYGLAATTVGNYALFGGGIDDSVLDKIDTYAIKPKVIKDILKEKKYPVHKINID